MPGLSSFRGNPRRPPRRAAAPAPARDDPAHARAVLPARSAGRPPIRARSVVRPRSAPGRISAGAGHTARIALRGAVRTRARLRRRREESMPTWQDFQTFIVAGLAPGGVCALSGVGLVVLYRATGVLNLSFGAVGAMGAFIAYSLIHDSGVPDWLGYVVCVAFGGIVTLAYGVLFGPPLAARDPLVKAVATLGLALILLGAMSWIWSDKARSMDLSTSNSGFEVNGVLVNWTQVIALGFAVGLTIVTVIYLRYTRTGTAMRALADDREITATLGVPVRRVEASAWFVSGCVSGGAGLLLGNLVGLDAATLTFLVISSLAAALIARLNSVVVTLIAGLAVGLVNAMLAPILAVSDYRDMSPFIMATIALLWLSRKDIRVTGVR